jgi:DNA-binding CsgD family transcriptional regulator
MATLIFLPFDQPFLVLENPLPANAFGLDLSPVQWQPPPPYLDWLQMQHPDSRNCHPCASLHGETIVITPGRTPSPSGSSSDISDVIPLSRRQREILRGLIAGLTIHEIAARLEIHPRTVNWHISCLKKMFGARSLVQSVARLVAVLDPPNGLIK